MLEKLRALLVTDPLFILWTALIGTVSLATSLFDSSGRIQHGIARLWSRGLLRIAGVRVEVEGLEKVSPGGSYVFVANHRSYMDAPCILPNISVEFRFLANKNLFRVPFIGYHLRRAGHLPVDSDSARESLKTMSVAARVIQERGFSVLVFPEGARTGGELWPFKDGAAFIAIKAGVPVVPVALLGVREVLPVGSLLVCGGRVRLRIGDPIPTLDLGLQDRTRLTQILWERMAELLGRGTEKQKAGAAVVQ